MGRCPAQKPEKRLICIDARTGDRLLLVMRKSLGQVKIQTYIRDRLVGGKAWKSGQEKSAVNHRLEVGC